MSVANREVANLLKDKSVYTCIWCQRICYSVCLSVRYFKTTKGKLVVKEHNSATGVAIFVCSDDMALKRCSGGLEAQYIEKG